MYLVHSRHCFNPPECIMEFFSKVHLWNTYPEIFSKQVHSRSEMRIAVQIFYLCMFAIYSLKINSLELIWNLELYFWHIASFIIFDFFFRLSPYFILSKQLPSCRAIHYLHLILSLEFEFTLKLTTLAPGNEPNSSNFENIKKYWGNNILHKDESKYQGHYTESHFIDG